MGGATIPSMNLIPSEYSLDSDSRTSRMCSRVRGADRIGLFGQLGAECGQRVLAPVPDQQFVTEVPAQPGQRGARRRLGHAKPLRGARHTALAQQLTQRHEQVQVEIGQVSDGTRHGATI